MAINYKLGNLDVNDTSPEVLAKLFGRKLGMPNQSVAAPTSMQEILGLPGKVADWDGQSNTDMTGTDAGFYTGKLPSLNSGGATGSWDSVQPEQQAKQTAQIAQVKAQSSLGKTPEEGKNTLQKLGMLFRGLGAITAAFDKGMRSKFIADRPGQQLTEELLKDEELRNQRMKEKRDEMYKRAVLSQKTGTGNNKMTELAAKVMMDSMNPTDQKAWIEANTKGGFLGFGQTVPTSNDYYNAKLQTLKPTIQALIGMGGTAGDISTDDTQAIEWAKANMSDPRAQQILQLHGLM